jgi:hypothetical protein
MTGNRPKDDGYYFLKCTHYDILTEEDAPTQIPTEYLGQMGLFDLYHGAMCWTGAQVGYWAGPSVGRLRLTDNRHISQVP